MSRFLVILALVLMIYAKSVFSEPNISSSFELIQPLPTQETLITVMQRMQTTTAVKIAYQEIRYLELLQEPWLASGVMYAMAPDLLVKEQQKPVREIMGARGNEMYYFDPVNDIRHHGVMAKDNVLSLNIAAFKALVNGDLQLLENMYSIAFSSNSEQWVMTLLGPGEEDDAVKIMVTGITGKPAHKIEVHQPDGDRNVFILAEAVHDEKLKKIILKLKQELLGE